MEKSLDTEIVLRIASLSIENVFVIPPAQSPTNFVTQQQRALSLISALSDEGFLARSSKVAILGGGVAGLTCALAIESSAGSDVTILSKYSKFEPFAQAIHRYVHPTVSLWPDKAPSMTTELPFLNWFAGDVYNVTRELAKQFSQSCDTKFLSGIFIKKLETTDNGLLLKGALSTSRRADSYYQERFDLVIIAEDFGRDLVSASPETTSYWQVDRLEDHARLGQFRNYIISGCGDGGLIDCLRLVFEDFGEGRMSAAISNELWDSEIAEYIKAGEQEFKAFGKHHQIDRVYMEAAKMLLKSKLFDRVKLRLASLTLHQSCVVLHDRSASTPFARSASPINKLLIAYALISGAISFVGEAHITLSENWVRLGEQLFERASTNVIFRLGHTPEYADFLSNEDLDRIRLRWKVAGEFEPNNAYQKRHGYETIGDLWRAGARPQQVASYIFPLAQKLARSEFSATLELEEHGFVIRDPKMDYEQLPAHLFGIPLQSANSDERLSSLETPTRSRVVSLCYSNLDQVIAKKIAQTCRDRGIPTQELLTLDTITNGPDTRLIASLSDFDVLVFIASESSLNSEWVKRELRSAQASQQIRDSWVKMIIVKIGDTPIDSKLSEHVTFSLEPDSENSLIKLAEEVQRLVGFDFLRLDSLHFEDLTQQILEASGFDVHSQSKSIDSGCDFDATIDVVDPFGKVEHQRWMVEVKHFRSERLSINKLSAFYHQVLSDETCHGGILFSTGQLTSVAREYAAQLTPKPLRIVERAEVTALLMRHPDIADRFFPRKGLA